MAKIANGIRRDRSRCRKTVKAAATMTPPPSAIPTIRVGAIRISAEIAISSTPVNLPHQAGYPHRTKSRRVAAVPMALNTPAPKKAAAVDPIKIGPIHNGASN
jgi:hypothetical protein